MTTTGGTGQAEGFAKYAVVELASVELPAEIFDVEANIPLIHQVVVAQQAAARQGTHSTKRRGEVRGGGRKPHKQKGTGRARQGSTRAPQFVGGGIVHGPKPRDYSQRTPKKMKAAALRGALSDRARSGHIHVMTSFGLDRSPKTKQALAALETIADVASTRFLCVLTRDDRVTWLSLRNVQNVHLIAVDQLNTYDVLSSDRVVFSGDAYEWLVDASKAARQATASERAVAESVAPQTKTPQLIEKSDSKSSHQDQLLESAHEAAMEHMGNLRSFRSTDPTIDGWSVSSDDVEFVAIERHSDHVLATWPSTMTANDAIEFFQRISESPDAVYADGDDDYLEFDDGSAPTDWLRISTMQSLRYLRVDVGTEVLIWEEPEEDHLSDNRFFIIEPRVTSTRLLSLITSTTERNVISLLGQVLDPDQLDLEPLNAVG